MISSLEFIVKSTLQKRRLQYSDSRSLFSKRVAKYFLSKLSTMALKCHFPFSIFLLPFSYFLLPFSIFLLPFSTLFTFLHRFLLPFTSFLLSFTSFLLSFTSFLFSFRLFFYFPSPLFYLPFRLFFTSLHHIFYFPLASLQYFYTLLKYPRKKQ